MMPCQTCYSHRLLNSYVRVKWFRRFFSILYELGVYELSGFLADFVGRFDISEKLNKNLRAFGAFCFHGNYGAAGENFEKLTLSNAILL